MTDHPSIRRSKMKPERSIEFIKNELLPEAVHDRCFCELGSREFVEFVSVEVESLSHLVKTERAATEYYIARMIVNFSGEPTTFQLVIKLLNPGNETDEGDRGSNAFLNEEMFYAKIARKYNLNIYPRCYVADMGRYGRPVIVLEDLEACGYVRRDDGKLDEDHLALCLKAVEGLHGRGLKLKADNFNLFREFYAKIIDTRLHTRSTKLVDDAANRISTVLKKLRYGTIEKTDLESDESLFTICHGNPILRDCFLFKYGNKKPIDVKIIGWNEIRYCSIVVDLALLLQDHVSSEDEAEKYLRIYFDAVDE